MALPVLVVPFINEYHLVQGGVFLAKHSDSIVFPNMAFHVIKLAQTRYSCVQVNIFLYVLETAVCVFFFLMFFRAILPPMT